MEKQVNKYWHIAYVIPGQEVRFAQELQSEGILCFMAVKLELNALGKKKVGVLFPGYVFFHGANAEKFFIRNTANKWKGYLYTIMSEDNRKGHVYYELENQIVLDLIHKQMNGQFDYSKPALIGVLRVGDEVIHTNTDLPNHVKGSGIILERNRTHAKILWENKVLKISLSFLRKKPEKPIPSEPE